MHGVKAKYSTQSFHSITTQLSVKAVLGLIFQDQASRDTVTFSIIFTHSQEQPLLLSSKKKTTRERKRMNLNTARTGPVFYLWGLGRWGRVMPKCTKDQPMSSRPRLKAQGQRSETCSVPTTRKPEKVKNSQVQSLFLSIDLSQEVTSQKAKAK